MDKSPPQPIRKLVAIMFTDIFGYTAMMGESEDRALETINNNRKIHQDNCNEYNGRIVKELGDGILMVFENGTEAVKCAIGIQDDARKINIDLRVGIHEGEIVFENGDVFGDGVNIAYRIQTQSAIGGIAISDNVYQIIRNKDEVETAKIGKIPLKNVREPLVLYQVISGGLATRTSGSSKVSTLISGSLILVVGILIGFFIQKLIKNIDAPEITRLSITVPAEKSILSTDSKSIFISPSGKMVIYAGENDESSLLYGRNITSFAVESIPGTEEAHNPFLSPDGKWIGFYSENKLRKVPFEGGKSIELCFLSEVVTGTWLPNDSIIIGGSSGEGLKIVSATTGKLRRLTQVNSSLKEWLHAEPYYISGSDKILYSKKSVAQDISINLLNYKTGVEKVLIQNAGNPSYHPAGFLIYEYEGSLFANTFNPESGVLKEPAILLIKNESNDKRFVYSVSNNGTLAYFTRPLEDRKGELVLVDMKGNVKKLRKEYDTFIGPKYSPDGSNIAFWMIQDKNAQVWIYNIEKDQLSRFTSEGENFWPIWSPDGQSLSYPSLGSSTIDMYWKPLESTESSKPLIELEKGQQPKAWTSDGGYLMYHQFEENEKSFSLFLLDMSNGKTEPFIYEESDASIPDFSPDDKWVVYGSDKTGTFEVYVTDFPAKKVKYQVSTSGGEEPLWSHKGDRIFYRKGGDFFVLSVGYDPEIHFGKPQKLFSGPFRQFKWGRYYDLSPDEKYIVTVRQKPSEASIRNISLITNWIEELKKRANQIN